MENSSASTQFIYPTPPTEKRHSRHDSRVKVAKWHTCESCNATSVECYRLQALLLCMDCFLLYGGNRPTKSRRVKVHFEPTSPLQQAGSKRKKRVKKNMGKNPVVLQLSKEVQSSTNSEDTSKEDISDKTTTTEEQKIARFHLYQKVRVTDADNEEWEAEIIDLQQNKVKVHYNGWNSDFDEWLPENSESIQPSFKIEKVDNQEPSTCVKFLSSTRILPVNSKAKKENLFSSFHVGQMVLVQDAKLEWNDAEVKEVNKSCILVEYISNSQADYVYNRDFVKLKTPTAEEQSSSDEICDYSSDDIYTPSRTKRKNSLGTKSMNIQKQRKGFYVGKEIVIKNSEHGFLKATVKRIIDSRILIEYSNKIYESEWLENNNPKIYNDDTGKESFKDENECVYEESPEWIIYCNKCELPIEQFRYYCTYCEVPTEGYDYESFDLCLYCFQRDFPKSHQHPRSSFAVQTITGCPVTIDGVNDGEFIQDDFLTTYCEDEFRYTEEKICSLCQSSDHEIMGGFVGPHPFKNPNTHEKLKYFWVHDACARYSPEVFVSNDNTWYNVAKAVKRGRSMRCAVCKEKGSTIGCFDNRCWKSFHIPCTQKPLSFFQKGVIYWCPIHEALNITKRDPYEEIFSCDVCKQCLENDWYTCSTCSQDYYSTYDLCKSCFNDRFPNDHKHVREEFIITNLNKIKEQDKVLEELSEKMQPKREKESSLSTMQIGKRFRRLTGMRCFYCWETKSDSWRRGFYGVLMCEDCFRLSPAHVAIYENSKEDHGSQQYKAPIEDYVHTHYLTRTTFSENKFDNQSITSVPFLSSYGPLPHQLYSLDIDTTYYDIPGRAPRWASHVGAGGDYHGTWLPQIVRWSLLRYTKKNDRVLSNFLGRGTDAIESFLLGRRCVGVDINPSSISLAQRNCSFGISPDHGITAEHRPIILQADSRKLDGALFESESYNYILSHPPYKDCVAYSSNIDGDLSLYSEPTEFAREMRKVISESWRLLKSGSRLTMCIGDNREHCFYIPVSFKTIRLYIEGGFELEELISKRQRFCQMAPLGTYLCVHWNFLMFTHEFICIFRKVDKQNNEQFDFKYDDDWRKLVVCSEKRHQVPISPISRSSVVMGTTWTFKRTSRYSFPMLCMSKLVERFGQDETAWEEITIKFNLKDKAIENNEDTSSGLSEMQDELSLYEKERRRRIQENNRMLLSLGLISELDQEHQNDESYLEVLLNIPSPPENMPLSLIVVPHLPYDLKLHVIPAYRSAIVDIARKAAPRLCRRGFLVVGVRDIRVDGKLWPMGMIILQDIQEAISDLKLKEFVVAVPEGFMKDRNMDPEDFVATKYVGDETAIPHLPIVHVSHGCYMFIF